MIDYTNEDVKREAKRVLHEAIRYIDGDTLKPVTALGNLNHLRSEVLMMIADATGVSDYFHVE